MTFVENWDSGQPNAFWDVGLQWDINLGPNPGVVAPYLDLITSEHNKQPDFMATVALLIQPLADTQAVMATIPGLFDIDVAAGDQLDAVGAWIGQSRDVAVPLTDIYFSLDSSDLGLDQGVMQGPFDPSTGLVQLPDDIYRSLLKTKILENAWDGTIPGGYTALAGLLGGNQVLIQDEEDNHMILALAETPSSPVYAALFSQGYVSIKPAGVKVDGFYLPYAPGVPYFGLDAENSAVSGLDVGAFVA